MKVDFVFDEGESKEDAYLIGKNIFGVFDGANSTNKFFYKGGKSGGLIAASIARDEFAKNKGSLVDMAVRANDKIRKEMLKEDIDISDKLNLWCTTAAAIRINKNSFEWLQVADSLVLVVYDDKPFKLLVSEYDHDKEVMLIWKKLGDKKLKNIKSIIWKEAPQIRLDANETYGSLNGEKKFLKFLKSGKENMKNVKHIILFTDGLFIPKENPEEKDDFDTFVKLFLEGGLKRVKGYVRKLEREDPNCWKYPRYKQYDDIAAISISF